MSLVIYLERYPFKDTVHILVRPVFSLGVSHNYMNNITNLLNLDSVGHRSCKRTMTEKTSMLHNLMCFLDAEKYQKTLSKNYLFPPKNVTSEGAVSHKVVYYQQLSIARF